MKTLSINGNGKSALNGHASLNGSKEESHMPRYSDEELEEFKGIILVKLEKARDDLRMYTEENENISPTDKAENNKLASRQVELIEHLENALIRIENKSYGRDRISGKLISKERLRVAPHATLSYEEKKKQEPAPPQPTMHKFH